MSSEFDELHDSDEPKDRSRYMWLGVLVIFLAALGIIYWQSAPDSAVAYVRLQHILIKKDSATPAAAARARELAQSLRERILRGERFETLAKDYSNDPLSAQRGGVMARAYRGDLDSKVEVYAWNAPIGEISEIVESSFGFHIIKVLERHIPQSEQYRMDLENQGVETEGQPAAQ